MDFRIFVEPQLGATYDDLLEVAQATERLGFDGFFRSDHYLKTHGPGDGMPGPTDAWTTIAGLARDTSRVRLGTLVSSATFRHPGILAIQVAQADQMSGGRVELGLGAGWYRREHEAYGIPFPEKRFGLLEDALAITTGLWSTPVDQRFNYTGAHYSLVDAPPIPKPVQDRIPIIIGGGGPRKTPALAARFATEFNIGFVPEATIAEKFAGVRQAAESIGRDPADLVYSVALPVAVGRDRAEYERRVAAIGADSAAFTDVNIGGTSQQAVDKLGRLAELGVDRVYLQTLDLHDLEHLELIAGDVLTQL